MEERDTCRQCVSDHLAPAANTFRNDIERWRTLEYFGNVFRYLRKAGCSINSEFPRRLGGKWDRLKQRQRTSEWLGWVCLGWLVC
ncbi:hypothetical protein CEXT_38071 [Caerostris extrusa]|uniref:Uncharacterized protein n=1 Tax=Caerostris extrusa TaxID=172846 RepID=A0AAV4N385_CAEEX|nr:hypothetical protein CEXT_38071 [Caerostris extrusa]